MVARHSDVFDEVVAIVADWCWIAGCSVLSGRQVIEAGTEAYVPVLSARSGAPWNGHDGGRRIAGRPGAGAVYRVAAPTAVNDAPSAGL